MNTKSKNIDPERFNNIGTESDEIIKKLKTDPEYCKLFFYGSKGKKCIVDSMRSKMLYDLRKDYNVVMAPDTFSSIVYLTLWADGTWSPLDTYGKRCTFFAWLKKVAKNAIIERLMEEHEIPNVYSQTVGNTRLTLLSRSEAECKMVIDDLMAGSKYHSLLTAIYVGRLSKEKIMECLHMEDAEYEEAKKKGEYKLKDALLRSAYYYVEDVLHSKSARVVTVSSEFVADLADWCKTKTGVNPLADVFGANLSNEEVHTKTVEFLYEFAAKLNWNDKDRHIWCQRFIENAAPVHLAQEVGRSREWLDTRYSRLNAKFKKAIKKWWNSHAA